MAIHTDRLERLAVALESYKEGPGVPEFDLRHWSETKYQTTGHLWWKQRNPCGTAACAVGLACLSGIFAADGLKAIVEPDGSLTPAYRGLDNWAAAKAFFGLNEKQAERLFMDDSYRISRGPIAAMAVAHRIRVLTERSQKSRRIRPQPRTTAAVEKIKAAALEPVND